MTSLLHSCMDKAAGPCVATLSCQYRSFRTLCYLYASAIS